MNKLEWINQAKENQKKLEYLISQYHPVRRSNYNTMTITAPNAEIACHRVRENIRKNFEGDPITQFAQAIKDGNINKIYKILSDTWFGVPESTDCWGIEGFKEAVDLMDDPPEQEDETSITST